MPWTRCQGQSCYGVTDSSQPVPILTLHKGKVKLRPAPVMLWRNQDPYPVVATPVSTPSEGGQSNRKSRDEPHPRQRVSSKQALQQQRLHALRVLANPLLQKRKLRFREVLSHVRSHPGTGTGTESRLLGSQLLRFPFPPCLPGHAGRSGEDEASSE